MLIIQDILISDEVIEKHFLCNLNACKGACCWEGDYGAPLETEELQTLEKIYDDIEPFLTPDGQSVIEEKGHYTYYQEPKEYGTPLLKNGACAYMTYDENGIAKCGIEAAWRAGATDFQKPISCHLYPVRVKSNKPKNFEALNYDRWDICSAACTAGKDNEVRIFEFVKAALIRKYGEDFYDELEAAVEHITSK